MKIWNQIISFKVVVFNKLKLPLFLAEACIFTVYYVKMRLSVICNVYWVRNPARWSCAAFVNSRSLKISIVLAWRDALNFYVFLGNPDVIINICRPWAAAVYSCAFIMLFGNRGEQIIAVLIVVQFMNRLNARISDANGCKLHVRGCCQNFLSWALGLLGRQHLSERSFSKSHGDASLSIDWRLHLRHLVEISSEVKAAMFTHLKLLQRLLACHGILRQSAGMRRRMTILGFLQKIALPSRLVLITLSQCATIIIKARLLWVAKNMLAVLSLYIA